jgi:hypothetical protein
VIGSNDDAHARTGDRILRNHSFTGLDIAKHKVFPKVAGVLCARPLKRREHFVGGPLDIDLEGFVRSNEFKRQSSIVLVALMP